MQIAAFTCSKLRVLALAPLSVVVQHLEAYIYNEEVPLILLLHITSRMFHPWQRLPTEVKLEVLQHALQQSDFITASRHLDNLSVYHLSPLIGTRNRELAQLSINACKPTVQDPLSYSHADYLQTTSRTPLCSLRTFYVLPSVPALACFDPAPSKLKRSST